MIELWPHMQRGVDATLEAIRRGTRRIVLTSPTGGGKTRGAIALAQHYLNDARKVVMYSNRKLLVEQTCGVIANTGMSFGVRAAGHFPDHTECFQISSIQTENARVLKAKVWELHKAELVIVDEGHLYTSDGVAGKIMKRHLEAGATVVYLTATPIGMGHMADELIVAGTNSELRKCGALVRVNHYGPDEPDLRAIGKMNLEAGKDLSEKMLAKAFPKTQVLFGRVLSWWRKLNPEGKPTILFASGVAESLWFAEQFWKEGVPSAHIDGEEVWVNGRFYRSDRAARDDVLAGSEAGRTSVLCNRFVLREGIDAPWLSHGIFATVFGSFQSYLQSGGRLLRSHPGVTAVTLQDHGGNWHRHGSLNADQDWTLESGPQLSVIRQERMRDKEIAEPFHCPKCGLIVSSLRCLCGWRIVRQSRPVVQVDGSIKEYSGAIYRPRRTEWKVDTFKHWKKCYFMGRAAGWTFRRAYGYFYSQNRYLPPQTLSLMPKRSADWFARITDFPPEGLIHGRDE